MTTTDTTDTTNSTGRSGAGEVLETMTGFDEIATYTRFGFDVFTVGEDRPMMMMRALAFVLRRRDTANHTDDAAAHTWAMSLTVADLNALLEDDTSADDDDDGDGDQMPATPAGKGEPAHDAPPMISRHSASPQE